jgi:hypothetical protein
MTLISLAITIIVTLIVVGLLLWAVEQIPMDAAIKRIIHVVAVVAVCLWLLGCLLSAFGLISSFPVMPVRIGR